MPTSPKPGRTDFSLDVLGRYVCNGLDEALRSADRTVLRPDDRAQIEARDFDLIVIGGGTFGAVAAEHMSFRDKARRHRVLVLEAGPVFLGEHIQNLPVLGLNPAGATSIQALRAAGQFGPDRPRAEVWGLPWHSPTPFAGLAYCLGGRSLYWGGWSPELLDAELPAAAWPAAVLQELRAQALPGGAPGYFRQASDQIGVTETNDFIFGELHRVLRARLLGGIGQVSGAIPLGSLPDHPAVRYADAPPTHAQLAELLGLPAGAPPPPVADAQNELKLEAPLAVQGRAGHAGFFPFNKFSTVPLLVKAAREAFAEAGPDDARKRLMIVPNCHVTRLETVQEGNEWRVTAVQTNQGRVPVPPGGKVVVALGTVESTRLVKDSFRGIPQAAWDRIGTNLMAHVRSNLDVRVPRTALPGLPAAGALQASALFVKGQHAFADGQGVGHFHLQITASGLGARGNNSEAELFKKIPDIDTYDAHRNANDTHVVITIRGIGEMQPHNPASRITLDAETDEFGVARAFVAMANPLDPQQRQANPRTARDFELWEAMDQAAVDVARLFGVAQPPRPRRDGLGTTHHETGGLWMGEAASDSVTLPDGRLRHTTNAYVAGPALFPTVGSPNPMLTGVALARRLGDRLVSSVPDQPDPGFTMLFDGFDTSTWRMTAIRNQPGRDNPGAMRVLDGALETVAGTDMGVFWCTEPTPPNFVLKLQWLRWNDDANSGVYLRFPDPGSKDYDNSAYVADDFGFEVQIDENGAVDVQRTGAVYRKDGQTDGMTLNLRPPRGPGEWNDYEIRVEGQVYTVALNGEQVCRFENTMYPGRGAPSAPDAPSFVGLQVYANPRHFVAFRRIQIRAI